MANPNIVNVTSIYGKTVTLAPTTTPTDIVTNVVGSAKIIKINSLIIANINGTSDADITVSLYRNSIEHKLAHTVSVPADSTFIALAKDASIYLEEGDAIRLTASANTMLNAICSYEDIS